jgi:ribonuclease T1
MRLGRLFWLLALLLSVFCAPFASFPGAASAPILLADSSTWASLEAFPAEERAAISATLGRIAAGGPFPYRQDGAIFSNREGLLPAKPQGYYHEYTVPTPGFRDRATRRIVAGSRGEVYYTDDHYRSFWRIR